MNPKRVTYLSGITTTITFVGWCFLFYLDWKIGLALTLIVSGLQIKKIFIDNCINNTLDSMLNALKILVGEKIEKLEQEKLEEIKKN